MTHEDPEQHRDDEAEPERVADPQHPGRDLDRVQVQEEVGERLEGPAPRRVERRVAEHRPPHVAALDPGRDPGARRVGDLRARARRGSGRRLPAPLRRRA